MEERQLDGEELEQLERVRPVARALDKSVRTYRLYEGRGKLVSKQLTETWKAIQAVTAHERAVMSITPAGLAFRGQSLSGGDDSVEHWFAFFSAGARELTLDPELPGEELRAFVALAASNPGEGEDQVLRFWRADFEAIHLYVAEVLLMRLSEGHESVEGELTRNLSQARSLLGAPADRSEHTVAMTEDDLRLLTGEDGLSWSAVAKAPPIVPLPEENVPAALKEREAHPGLGDSKAFVELALRAAAVDPSTSDAALSMVVATWDTLLQRNAGSAARSLAEAVAGGETPTAFRTLDQLAEADRLTALAPLVDEEPEAWAAVLEALAGVNQDGVVTLIRAVGSAEARAAVRDAATRAGCDLVRSYSALIKPGEAELIAEAIHGLTEIEGKDATAALGHALEVASGPNRYLALRSLEGRYDRTVRTAVLRCLGATERPTRGTALRLLSHDLAPSVSEAVLKLVESPGFVQRSDDEKEAVFSFLARRFDGPIEAFCRRMLAGRRLALGFGGQDLNLRCVRLLGEAEGDAAQALLEEVASRRMMPRSVREAVEAAMQDADEEEP